MGLTRDRINCNVDSALRQILRGVRRRIIDFNLKHIPTHGKGFILEQFKIGSYRIYRAGNVYPASQVRIAKFEILGPEVNDHVEFSAKSEEGQITVSRAEKVFQRISVLWDSENSRCQLYADGTPTDLTDIVGHIMTKGLDDFFRDWESAIQS